PALAPRQHGRQRLRRGLARVGGQAMSALPRFTSKIIAAGADCASASGCFLPEFPTVDAAHADR
ncbi:MAG: hypothetical protein J0L74_13620, partial [Burkholderiales bacterium]|nr:hypothetical protein [Burkholderiales bacterium]